jgi:predicted tellurium resistance membrane protein TerC
MDWIGNPDIWISFFTLALLEIVLGIDNIVFISILSGKLPTEQQARARNLGLGLAMVMRILLLLGISWVIGLTTPLFEVLDQEISGRDIIMLVGGLFLLTKATFEIHEKLEGHDPHTSEVRAVSFTAVIVQILALDIVFSLDSVITAVGMADEIGVMIAAVVVAVGVMLLSAGTISEFVNRHPTVKMLALSFLLLIGMSLVAEGLDFHIPKGYIYFAMGFSIFVEALNLRLRKKVADDPVQLRPTLVKDPQAAGAVGHLHASPADAEGQA